MDRIVSTRKACHSSPVLLSRMACIAVAPSGAFEGLIGFVVDMLMMFTVVAFLSGVCSASRLGGRRGRIIRSMDDVVCECDEEALGSSYILAAMMGNL